MPAMLRPKSSRSRQRSKLISFRVEIADYQLLHQMAGKGGVQGVLDEWVLPLIAQRRAEMKRLDAECCGEKGEGK